MSPPGRPEGEYRSAKREGPPVNARRRLVLLGAGHSHAQVLHDLASHPLADVEVIVVSPSPMAPYSGMVPGWLAGFYTFDAICINFARLAQAAGAAFVADAAHSLDANRRCVTLAGGETLNYDVLSIDIGSTLNPPSAPNAGTTTVLPLRPLAALQQRWDAVLAGLSEAGGTGPLRITAVGGGAAGVESLLAVQARLRSAMPSRPVEAEIASGSASLLPGMAASAARRMHEVLRTRGIGVRLGHRFDASEIASHDLVLWATGAEAHGWPRASGLAVNRAGFIRVDDHLRSVSHAQVFAAGDCIAWPEQGLPKAGVFAVKMGPVLSRNLRAVLGSGERLAPFKPQHRFLSLLSTADRRAIATWGRWSVAGGWVWRWKNHIDRRWVDRFTVPMSMAMSMARKNRSSRFDPSPVGASRFDPSRSDPPLLDPSISKPPPRPNPTTPSTRLSS